MHVTIVRNIKDGISLGLVQKVVMYHLFFSIYLYFSLRFIYIYICTCLVSFTCLNDIVVVILLWLCYLNESVDRCPI